LILTLYPVDVPSWSGAVGILIEASADGSEWRARI
jgi:hypothetical protein